MLPDAHFTGFLTGDDLADAVASFDVFVHCGEVETFCQTIQEALASGVPVVAPRRGGPIDLVDHGETGFLYTPGQLDEFVGYVSTLVEDNELRERFSAHCRMSVEGRTWEKVCDGLMDYYAEATKIRGQRPSLKADDDKVLRGLMWRPGEVASAKARGRRPKGDS
jgi:phosphatidylinositol alpha 1,6-mannosyltransferase